jgi:hypothetical protein
VPVGQAMTGGHPREDAMVDRAGVTGVTGVTGEAAAPRAGDAGESTANGPRDFVVEEERLPDGRAILYYAWPVDPGDPRKTEPAAPRRKAAPR